MIINCVKYQTNIVLDNLLYAWHPWFSANTFYLNLFAEVHSLRSKTWAAVWIPAVEMYIVVIYFYGWFLFSLLVWSLHSKLLPMCTQQNNVVLTSGSYTFSFRELAVTTMKEVCCQAWSLKITSLSVRGGGVHLSGTLSSSRYILDFLLVFLSHLFLTSPLMSYQNCSPEHEKRGSVK